ncbi:MAG: hypothetical protein LBJ72_11955 [Dysgonamonadaceae bacterium]|jgi:hypothetical protein|nr:hypothetical protein [Dysgonamonadaceae bacterium]
MNLNDNIGGYKKIEFLPRNQIQSMVCSESAQTCFISIKQGAQWTNIPAQYGTGSMLDSPNRGQSGVVYKSAIDIYLPNHIIDVELKEKLQNLCLHGGVIRYTTHDDETFVIGCMNFPLRATMELNHPGKVSGFKCTKLSLTSQSSHAQLKSSN